MRAREIAAVVAAAVAAQATRGDELLDVNGNEALRAARARELPRLSTNDLLTLAAEVSGTAHVIAAVEWRDTGHRAGDTPQIGFSTLEAGLLIHLHASPESVPAQIRAATWTEHAELFKRRLIPSAPPHETSMGTMGSAHRRSSTIHVRVLARTASQAMR